MRLLLLLLACLVLAGCSATPQPLRVPTDGVRPAADFAPLAAVLKGGLNAKGQPDLDDLAKLEPALDRQLAILTVTGPRSTPTLFPTPEDRLAYWYNAMTAWSLKIALIEKLPEKLPYDRLHGRAFAIDGGTKTLADIRQVLAGDEDFRTAVVAPCVCLEGARLPSVPFEGGTIRAVIAARFDGYMDDSRRVVIDVASRQVRIPPALWAARQRLIDEYNRTFGAKGANLLTALLPHVHGSAYRRLQDAIGYATVPAGPSDTLDLPHKFAKLLQGSLIAP